MATASFPFGDRPLFKRYPQSQQQSLQAWNAADELLWEQVQLITSTKKTPLLIAHDRFGVQTCLFAEYKPQVLALYASEQKAIGLQLQWQGLSYTPHFSPLLNDDGSRFALALLKMPKSIDLFKWYLQKTHTHLQSQGQIIVSFMTKHFSEQWLKIAAQYFDNISQSRAKKKARLLYLSEPKKDINTPTLMHTIAYAGHHFEQYYGVFSAKRIDAASLFLLDFLKTEAYQANSILDVGTGNGVLAWQLAQWQPQAQCYMSDDAALAIASAKRNIGEEDRFHYIYDDGLDSLPSNSIDMVVSNPPFHFEYENNIEVSLSLFKQIYRVLQQNGVFYCVANKHLNYAVHLQTYFAQVQVVAHHSKYEIIKSIK